MGEINSFIAKYEAREQFKGISVSLSKEKSEKFFHSALCNGLGEISQYGYELDYNDDEYTGAKKTLQEKIKKGEIPIGMSVYSNEKLNSKSICYEDVLVEILRNGGKLGLRGNGEFKIITLSSVHKRVQKTDLRHLIEYINETGGDAVTADVILQTVFLNKVIYG